MSGWQQALAPLIRAVEKRYDALKIRLYYALGGPGPVHLLPYRGYGTRQQLYLTGRVLEKRGITPPSETDSAWDNLLNMLKRIESYEVPHARLLVRLQDNEQEVRADEEGMFEVRISATCPLATDRLWHPVTFELLEPLAEGQTRPVRATGQALVPLPDARFGVISDIDDTVLQADAATMLRMARTFLLNNARTRLPFAGVAAFYRALYAGSEARAANPMFYVSNSPWNLYDLLVDFFHLNRIPIGPILLRNWGVYEDELLPTRQREYKMGHIRPILDLYPDLPFILIGDSREADPQIYHEIVQEHGQRILAVYIRNVSSGQQQSAVIRALTEEVVRAGSQLVLADDTLAMARHAARHGWIAPGALDQIRIEQEKGDTLPEVGVERSA